MAKKKAINATQELIFKLVRKSSYGRFNGDQIVDDLERNPSLWRSVYADRSSYLNITDLSDIECGLWHIDNLIILPVPGKEDELLRLAERWHADSIAWLSGGDWPEPALRLWW